ncbi:hypothetical protein [Geomonas azotofigens]|uniref:hypothetical protein n=1 Tax=Geomonas azotofigens TaxID=2843196 RepID=UPI001C10AEDA|nr:hypothetical protein [Geomonas azotofigens]MBU5613077.1 hypothetical protein [Geomonas azotofigens]
MRKLFWLFMMLLLTACGGGGGGGTTAGTPTSGKGSLSLELVQSGAKVAKTVANLPVSHPGRVRVVLNENTTHYRQVIDKAYGETFANLEVPVGIYTVEAIFYESGTPNILTDYGISAGAVTVTTAGGSAAVTLNPVSVTVTPSFTGAQLFSGSQYNVGTSALASAGLQDSWRLSTSTSAFTGRQHLAAPAAATHTGLTAPAIAQSGNLYLQGEFFVKATLLDSGESANNWAFYAEAAVPLALPTVPITISVPANDGVKPVVNSFSVPSTKVGTNSVPEISIQATDNGGIKEYAITYSEDPAAAAPAPVAADWQPAPSFTYPGVINTTDKTVYLFAWVRDFGNLESDQVVGVTKKAVVFNATPVVTSFTTPNVTVMDGSKVAYTIVGKSYVPGALYCKVTTSATPPAASDITQAMNVDPVTGVVSFPGEFAAVSLPQTAGLKYNVNLYAWVKDANGTVSPSVVRPVVVDDSPQITALAATGATSGNVATITKLTEVHVTGRTIVGYALTNTNVKPLTIADNGAPVMPLTYTFTSGITSTNPTSRAVYVWLKDSAGAISSVRGVAVTLSAPTVTP